MLSGSISASLMALFAAIAAISLLPSSSDRYLRSSIPVRAGYFHESANKGNRQFFTLGAGFKFRSTILDVSYLINASDVNNPLESTLRFSLTINLGDSYAYF